MMICLLHVTVRSYDILQRELPLLRDNIFLFHICACNASISCDNASSLCRRILTPTEGDWLTANNPAGFPLDRAPVNAMALMLCRRLNESEHIWFCLHSPIFITRATITGYRQFIARK